MIKFGLFVKSEKFYWSTNKIIYSICFFCLALLFVKGKILNLESNLFDRIFQWTIVLTLICGLVTKFKGFTQIAPLNGKIDGFLIFEQQFIKVKDEVFPIETIRKIQISNEDYHGKLSRISKGNFGPALSNGTNNFIVIFFESGKTKRFQFELLNSNDFQNIRETLIDYHLIGKIDYWELAQVLGEKSTSDTLDLTSEIEKRSTTTNNY